ncbi:hypothetical protein VOLCADRAFT_116413 [Volvox carteri f. nagariensis]|uniref:Glycosyltransferase family 92 protein n=1 Tax=Volvox carteri f. nagariensis TaxID=3068 RepID=D8TLX2_VOLCA|nr:uncharacterized protein VOLCADRAFT_116413 [Volvox carteri f. nagariensis]EFJ51536.1 hypothetical protein VOLCADRAFT_116413 [Volvox carteri f. nagariensis]|eukprot:XP_002947488.1 hypothetical protein VOLCADRAFT_116413 [Volvox carteri f. nagariensis]
MLLCLLLRQSSFAHFLYDSADVGVHKCEFQGKLGDKQVRLYVFLTACTRPKEVDLPAAAAAVRVPVVAAAAAGSTAAAAEAGGRRRAAIAAEAAERPYGSSHTASSSRSSSLPPPPPPPNLFLSGFTFLMDLGDCVTSTQLQQPLSTLLWAARRPQAEFFLPDAVLRRAASSSDGSSSSSSSSNSYNSNSYNKSVDANRGTGNDVTESSSTTGSGSSGEGSSSSNAGGGDGISLLGDDGRTAQGGRRRLMQDGELTAPPGPPPPAPDTFPGAVREAGLQLVNGTYGIIRIRSLHSRQQYDMHLSYRDTVQWLINPSLRKEPGRLVVRLSLEPTELAAIANAAAAARTATKGAVQSVPPAFEVTADGFEGTCAYTPSAGDQMLSYTESGSRQSLIPSLPICGWLDPNRVSYDKSMYEFWRTLQSPPWKRLQQQKKKRRRLPPPPPPPPPLATSFTPPSYMVISPYFNLTPYDFATLLCHHLEYHTALGIQKYLVYIEEGEEGLMADARLAALAAAGRLQLVRWRELPAVKLPGTDVRQPYAHQGGVWDGLVGTTRAASRTAKLNHAWHFLSHLNPSTRFPPSLLTPFRRRDVCVRLRKILSYNHALLSLWHLAAVVAVADLDEYLLTQRPMTLEQVVFSCSPPGRYPPGALWVPRRNALCTTCWAALVGDLPETRTALRRAPHARSPNGTALRNVSGKQVGNATLVAAAAALERQMWLTAAAATSRGGGGGGSAAAVLPYHPLEHYRHWREGNHHKSIMYSHLVSYFGVHMSYSAVPGRRPHTVARLGCAVWAHLGTQLGPRQGAGGDDEVAGGKEGDDSRRAQPRQGGTTTASATPPADAGRGVQVETGVGVQRTSYGSGEGAVAVFPPRASNGREAEGEEEETGEEDGNADIRDGDGFGAAGGQRVSDRARGKFAAGTGAGAVLPVEGRYYWALNQRLGRRVPWERHWGQKVGMKAEGVKGVADV